MKNHICMNSLICGVRALHQLHKDTPEPVPGSKYASGLPDAAADLVYALETFHTVENQDVFLAELRRITKPDGTLILDDGHQPRKKTRRALLDSGFWTIEEETGEYLRCRPL
ncbi:MAG: class I SAM-dependent methyltransferase [Methanoculleus marisnigri]|jgi:SAM-dependent methyltransferase|nr:class I SAM-dependent methyltransferase [Methanoculleus marisnigri]